MDRRQKLLDYLTKESLSYSSDRVYFLPNHDKKWLDSIINKTSKPKILVVGGVLYGSYLSGKGLDVTVIEKNPLAAIFQLYVCDLLNRGLNSKQILKTLLTDKFLNSGNQYNIQSFCSESEFNLSINELSSFSGQSIKSASGMLQKIFNSSLVNDRVSMTIFPKGFNVESFEKQNLKLPNKIVISDISSIKNIGKFDLVITNNVVDFFDTPKDFLEIISKLVKPNSTIEVSTYSTETSEYLSKRFESKKQSEVGSAYIYKKVDTDSFKISRLPLVLGKNIFYLLGKDLLSESYVPAVPYWLDQLLKVSIPGRKYSLFKKNYQYVTCHRGVLTHN